MISAVDVAKYVIHRANLSGKSITHLKLQKILYYIQGEFLKAFGRPLFYENIEAWQYGPVVPDVYYKYVPFGALNLFCEADGKDSIAMLPVSEQLCIDQVIDRKLNYSASALVSAVHKEKPWMERAESVKHGQRPVIPVDSIRQYFKEASL